MKWPVEIFRYSENKGWELYQQSTSSSKKKNSIRSSSTTSSFTKKIKNNTKEKSNASNNGRNETNDDNCDDDEVLTVVPRQGCVEVKKLRLRIHLFYRSKMNSNDEVNPQKRKRNTTTTTAATTSATNRSPSITYHTTVTRRRDTILLSSRKGGLGAVVFKFRSIADCMSFSDKLIELNSEFVLNQTQDKEVQRAVIGGSDSSFDGTRRPIKRNKVHHSIGGDPNTIEDASTNGDEAVSTGNLVLDSVSNVEAQQQHQSMERIEAIQSYVVRLLHDGDFMNFVDHIEKSLVSSPDCKRILEALDIKTRK